MRLFLIILACLSLISVKAQCVADAGGNKHSCEDDPDAHSILIGGIPAASNGLPPYTYSWSIAPLEFAGTYIYASDILDDTTTSNPKIIYRPQKDSLVLYLEVTDYNGCVSYDSCKITYSHFNVNLSYLVYDIELGDSVYLDFAPNVSGGVGSLTYDWNPSDGLSDTSLEKGFWAKPDTSINYTLTIEDSMGCTKTSPGPFYFINISPVGINEPNQANKVNVFPNPATDIVTIEFEENREIKRIKLINSAGQEILNESSFGFTHQVDVSSLANGNYIIEIISGDELIRSQFIKK